MQYVKAHPGQPPKGKPERDVIQVPVPPFYVRYFVAQKWGIPPWEVGDDREMHDEIGRWLETDALVAHYGG